MTKEHSFHPDSHTHMRRDLDHVPEIARALGNLCVAWAAIEFRAYAFFVRLTGMSAPIARACFYSHFNARARFRLLLSVATMLFSQDDEPLPELKELDDLLTAIGKTGLKRNKYIHDPWGSWDARDSEIFQVALDGKEILGRGRGVKEKHITQLVTQLHQHADALYDLYARVSAIVEPLQKKLAQLQGLDLVFARTDIPRKIRSKEPRPLRKSSPEKPSSAERRKAALARKESEP